MSPLAIVPPLSIAVPLPMVTPPSLALALPPMLLAAAVLCWPAIRDLSQEPSAPNAAGRQVRTLGWHAWPARIWRAVGHPRAGDEDAEILALVEGIAAALEAGLTPASALSSAASGLLTARRDSPVRSGPVARAMPGMLLRAQAGEGLATGWHELADQHDLSELRLVARSWALSEATGAPLAEAARTAARLVRESRDQRRRTATAVAGAKATMTILTLLPLGGPALAAVMGLDLIALYATSPLVWACLAGGLLLVAIGRWWVHRLVVSAMRGPVLT